jgi:hypothetical protein
MLFCARHRPSCRIENQDSGFLFLLITIHCIPIHNRISHRRKVIRRLGVLRRRPVHQDRRGGRITSTFYAEKLGVGSSCAEERSVTYWAGLVKECPASFISIYGVWGATSQEVIAYLGRRRVKGSHGLGRKLRGDEFLIYWCGGSCSFCREIAPSQLHISIIQQQRLLT